MTTPAAARQYLAEHLQEWGGKGYAVYNPHEKPIEDLPVIYGFNNGGGSGFLSAIAIAEDGTVVGGHACSSEAYMPHDLGIVEGAREDRHETVYQVHYPDGYRMDFVTSGELEAGHAGLDAAVERHQADAQEATA